MKLRIWNLIVPALIFLAVFPLCLAAAVDVCHKCGYENWKGGLTCEHCNAEFPAKTPVASPVAESTTTHSLAESGKLSFIEPSLVLDEILAGENCAASGAVDVAQMFFKNAIALELLTDPSKKTDRSAKAAELILQSEKGRSLSQSTCPVCGGTGKTSMTVVDLKGNESSQEIHGKACPRCKGTGKIQRAATVDERKIMVGQAIARYKAMQQGRRFVAVGHAWIPAELERILSKRQSVLLRRAVPQSCPKCVGIGRTDCPDCHGAGDNKCSNKQCAQGKVRVEVEAALTKSKLYRTEKCKTCGGTGSETCVACSGSGGILCKQCNGSGELPACKKCSGQGLLECSKCHGSGSQANGACKACGGEGVMVCASCSGDGKTK